MAEETNTKNVRDDEIDLLDLFKKLSTFSTSVLVDRHFLFLSVSLSYSVIRSFNDLMTNDPMTIFL